MASRRGLARRVHFIMRRRGIRTSSLESWVKVLGTVAALVAAATGVVKLWGDEDSSSPSAGSSRSAVVETTPPSANERGSSRQIRVVPELRPAPSALSTNAKSIAGYPLAADEYYPICLDVDGARLGFCESNFVLSVQAQCQTKANIRGIRDLLSLGERHSDAVSRLPDDLRSCYVELFNHVRPHERAMADALREAREKADGDPTLEVVLHDVRDLSASIIFIGNSRGRKVGDAAPPDVLSWVTENATSCRKGQCNVVGMIEEARRADGRLVSSIEKKYNSHAYLYYEDGAIVWIRCENRTPMAARE